MNDISLTDIVDDVQNKVQGIGQLYLMLPPVRRGRQSSRHQTEHNNNPVCRVQWAEEIYFRTNRMGGQENISVK